jgi:L-2-hydroxyglutarate oxidase LhgO
MDTNITIIGAGVVGLAIAANLSERFPDVFVLEKHEKFGQETSSRNSEVVHSGIYYPSNSLKACLCVEGNKMLYDYCEKNDINHKKCGKLVVATDQYEEVVLQKVFKQSKFNGVLDGLLLSKDQALKLEPNIFCTAAIFFPSTGIVDSHGLMKQLESDAIINQATFAYNAEVVGIEKFEKGYLISVREASGTYSFTANTVINAAGLGSDTIAELSGTFDPSYQLYFWKGAYFAVGNGKNKLIEHLVYPVPHENTIGLGVHATLDLSHGLKLGPDATFIEDKKIDYTVPKTRQTDFYQAARKFLPFLEEGDLHPDQAGIRPKLQKPGDPTRDFIIKDEQAKGMPGFINLIGIESPGLTSCLSIAKMVSRFSVFAK